MDDLTQAKRDRDQMDSSALFHESQRRSRLVRIDPRGYPFAGLGVFLGIMAALAFWGGAAYVVAHFVLKYW